MSKKYDAHKLRSYLIDRFGSAMTAGFDMAIQELTEVSNAGEEELVEIAKKNNIDVTRFEIKEEDMER